jgi:hypothetical protein
MKAVFLFLILSFGIGCTQTSTKVNNHLLRKFEIGGHWSNHCGGVNVPMCNRWVDGEEVDRTNDYMKTTIKTFGENLIKSLLTGK